MTRRLNRWLLALLLVAGLPGWLLTVDNHPGSGDVRPLRIEALRAMADALPGPRPARIRVEAVARGSAPGTLLAAGIGFAPRPLAAAVYRLDAPGGRPVIVGRMPTAAEAAILGLDAPDSAAARRVASALARALAIPANLARPTAIAPGVVVIPAGDLRPGGGREDAMVYVRMTDGGEWLFAGPAAPMEAGWRELRAPSRFTQWRLGESRTAAFDWLATIRRLQAAAPALTVVPGLDGRWLDEAVRQRRVVAGFGG